MKKLHILGISLFISVSNFARASIYEYEPPPGTTAADYVVPSEWPLNASLVDGTLYFDWKKDPDIFLFSKEDCATCEWEMFPEQKVSFDATKYYSLHSETETFFEKRLYTLKRTFSYTVNWTAQNPAGFQYYEVIFSGAHNYAYTNRVDTATSFTFPHLDPAQSPWTFTVYTRTANSDQSEQRQYEISQILLAASVFVDTDGNKVDDNWQKYYFPGQTFNPLADSDGDGINNLDEYIAGTDPHISSVAVSGLKSSRVNGQQALSFLTKKAVGIGYDGTKSRYYTLQSSPDLSPNSWTDVQVPSDSGPVTVKVLGNDKEFSYAIDPAGFPRYFYRLKISLE